MMMVGEDDDDDDDDDDDTPYTSIKATWNASRAGI